MVAHLKLLQRLGALVVIFGAVLLVYWPAQRNGFVWDDTALVLRDPLIRSWRLIPEAFSHFLFIDATASNFYRPLQRLTFLADYALWGFSPRGFHLTSVYGHMAAAVGVFVVGALLLAKRREGVPGADGPDMGASSQVCKTSTQTKASMGWALGVAVLWAIHPMHTSAVTYIAGRADPLAAFFGFSALALAWASLERQGRARIGLGAGAALCFFAALLSKESGVFALIVWCLFLLLRKQHGRVLAAWGGVALTVLAGYGALRWMAEKVPPPSHVSAPGATARPLLAARALAEYSRLFIAPRDLHMERDVATRPGAAPEKVRALEFQTWAGAVLALGLAAWAFWAVRVKNTGTVLALSGFLAAYLPISNVFPLNASVAEHWFYVPGAFLLMGAAATLREVLGRFDTQWPRRVVFALLALWAGMLGVTTWNQQSYWLDSRTFFSRSLAATGSARMSLGLGNLELGANHLEAAREAFSGTLRAEPNLPFACLSMAALEIRAGNLTEAHAWLDRVPADSFLAAETLQMRASLEAREKGPGAIALLAQAVECSPRQWPLRMRYLRVLEQSGQKQEAARQLRAFLEREPFRAESWSLMGDFLADLHQTPLALEAFRRATELDVHDEESRARIALIERIGFGR